MLVDDKNDPTRPPPEYSEVHGASNSSNGTYNWAKPSTSAGAAAGASNAQYSRHASTLYDRGDMDDPFSNAAAPPVPSSSRGYMYDDRDLLGSTSPPGGGHERRASTTLRAVSPHLFEYVPPPDVSPNDGDDENSMASARRRPSGPSGPRQASLNMGGGGYGSVPAPHASYYDEELEHEHDNSYSFQQSPTMDDGSPFRPNRNPNGTRKRGSSSSSNQLLDNRDLEHRGIQPLGMLYSSLRHP